MPTTHIMLLLLINILWGGCYIVVNELLEIVEPLTLGALRFSAVAICLLPFLKKIPIKPLSILTAAIILSVGHIYLSQVVLNSDISVASVIVILELGVPFTSVFSYLLLGQRLSKIHALALFLAMLATVIIFGTPDVTANLGPALLGVLSSVAIAYINVFITKHNNVNVVQMVGWLALLSTPIMWLLTLIAGEQQVLASITSKEVIWGLVYLSVISVVFAETLFYHLMRLNTVNGVVIFLILVPVTGVLLSNILYQEVLSDNFWLGFTMMLAAVVMVFYADRKATV